MRCAPAWRAFHIARLPLEFIRPPVNPVGAAFDYDLPPVFRHDAEKPISIYNPKCLDASINEGKWAWPIGLGFTRREDKPGVERKCDDQDSCRCVGGQSTW